MVTAPLSLRKDYWTNFEVTDEDLEFLYNYLLEVERPQKPENLIRALVAERIRKEKAALEKKMAASGAVFMPKETYEVGQTVQFPALDWRSGKVINKRPGNNPDLPPFKVIEVEFENGERRNFATGLEEHKLNEPLTLSDNDPLLDLDYVLENFGEELTDVLKESLEGNPDLVRIGWEWFPRALLVDINIGHLNLAEAVLDMMGGGPMLTRDLMEQVDLPTDVDAHLNEFSLNLAMHEDKRFDEVGPAGEVLWFLHRLEPEPVRQTPLVLRYTQPANPTSPDLAGEVQEMLDLFEPQVIDELEPGLNPPSGADPDEVAISLIYPHWRAGTLPLAGDLAKLFPTAYESPRIRFDFVDGNSGEKFSGWVVRQNNYVYGLRDWYLAQGLIPGGVLRIQRGQNPGEVIIRAEKKRATREWIRTAVIGSDGGVVYSMLKHNIGAVIDERLAIVISDVEMLDQVWEQNSKKRTPLPQLIRQVMIEMSKLSPQNHVHAQELYAGVNILRRCPPGPILSVLLENPWAQHLGNLYFRLEDISGGDNT